MFVPLSYNVRSLLVRKARSALTILGIGAVVAVYVVMSAVSAHMTQMFKSNARPDEVIVTQAGAITPEFSQANRTVATWLATLPQVATEGARPLISSELSLATRMTLPSGREVDGLLRGLAPDAVALYRDVAVPPGVGLTSGAQVLVGAQLARAHGLRAGDTLGFERTKWTVAGVFTARGGVLEQEVWVDLDTLAAAANRTSVTGFTVRTRSAQDAASLVEAVGAQHSYPVMAQTAEAVWARVGGMSRWMAALGRFIAIIIALGAVFGGMNTMYSAVAQRSREIGILRAVGYRRGAVLTSMLFESVLVGLAGGVVGALLAFGVAHVPLNMPFLLEGGVPLRAADLASGLGLGLMVGALGGILPALQAGAVKAVDALR